MGGAQSPDIRHLGDVPMSKKTGFRVKKGLGLEGLSVDGFRMTALLCAGNKGNASAIEANNAMGTST
jgi:hypothetical protein